jgi:hypothetical protein
MKMVEVQAGLGNGVKKFRYLDFLYPYHSLENPGGFML